MTDLDKIKLDPHMREATQVEPLAKATEQQRKVYRFFQDYQKPGLATLYAGFLWAALLNDPGNKFWAESEAFVDMLSGSRSVDERFPK